MVLTTTRLLLRELGPNDAEALNEIESNPDVTRFMSFDPQSLQQTRDYLTDSVRKQAESPRTIFDFAIVLSTTDANENARPFIGRCGFGIRRSEHREAEMWYLLHPAHVGRGYATEAATALLNFAFGSLDLHRVYADCDPRNHPSCRVVQRLGLQLEGVLRENYWLRGEWCSASIYGILADEWTAAAPSRSAQTQII